MALLPPQKRPTIGVLAGWQYYNLASSLNYLMPITKGIINSSKALKCNLLLGCGLGGGGTISEPYRPAWPSSSPDVDFVPIGPWNTDGLIVFAPLHSKERSEYLNHLISNNFPIQFIGSGESGHTLAVDNTGGIFEAVQHLIDHGHRKIAFIAGSPDDLKGDSGERLNAYHSALQAHGLPIDPRRIAFGNHIFTGGYNALMQIVQSGVDFSAIVASNDESALGAMQAMQELGIKIPEDVSLIGFDDRLEAVANDPSLSSIHIPLYQIGRQAVASLLDQINGNKRLPEIIRIQTHLICRESCGCMNTQSYEDKLSSPNSGKDEGNLENITASIAQQAKMIDSKESLLYCQQLSEAFFSEIEKKQKGQFENSLRNILNQPFEEDEDVFIWKEAVMLIDREFRKKGKRTAEEISLANRLVDSANQAIISFMQTRHLRFIANLGRMSNNLSLLTAELLSAHDEDQIYKILHEQLPLLHINRMLIVNYEKEGKDEYAWSTVKDIFNLKDTGIRYNSKLLPLNDLVKDNDYQLVFIPFAQKSGLHGYVIFSCDQIDILGTIVQLAGGAFNSANLYRDATEGRRLAEEANLVKSRFLSVVGHELRTPINLILGLSEIILRNLDEGEIVLPEITQKDIEQIFSYSQHLGGLIGDVLDLATSEAGQLRLNYGFVDLGQSLSMVAESGLQLAVDKGLSWEADLPESGPWVWGDRLRLRQVALNLINNAVKFTDHGFVKLKVETGPDFVKVIISDSGLGISAKDQQYIFNEFQQGENSTKLGYGGLGLGLAISKKLIEMHGGKIGVQSTGEPGSGSTFFFTLPTIPVPGESEIRQFHVSSAVRNALILTGHKDECGPFMNQLRKQGIRVKVHSLEPADDLQSISYDAIPDIILVDVDTTPSSPNWKAFELIKRNLESNEIPIFYFKISEENVALFELNTLTKPIELDALNKKLDLFSPIIPSEKSARNVLIVEDEPKTLDLNTRIVKTHSAENKVFTAQNGIEAIEILKKVKIDLVLLDLQMPKLDGFGVLEYIRGNEDTRNLQVIILTGKVLTDTDLIRLNNGAAKVLEKGLFSLDETVKQINDVINQKNRISVEAQQLVRKAMSYIHEHYQESISRREIARQINISEDYLTVCFRKELGATPIEYLHRYRVNKAKQLLKSKDRSISQIALEVGFTDSGYFSRIFRRITGQSPDAYRRTN